MTFNDILKKSFLEGYAMTSVGTYEIVLALAVTAIISVYIFFCYRLFTRRTFYSKTFNITLMLISIITAAIILTIQSSVVVSLGMVGALSIVRFRTAIKDPMDLAFLFWSISVGIICGAGLAQIAVILSVVISAVLFLFDMIPLAKAPVILVINAQGTNEMNAVIESVVKKYTKKYTEKSRSMANKKLDLILEIRVDDGASLVQELSALDGIYSVTLLKHDGEVTF